MSSTESAPAASPREAILQALAAIRELDDVYRVLADASDIDVVQQRLAVLRDGVQVALTALAESIGECRVELPYAAMQHIRHADGTEQMCCNHPHPHCTP